MEIPEKSVDNQIQENNRGQRTLHPWPTAKVIWPHLGPQDKDGEFQVSFTVIMKMQAVEVPSWSKGDRKWLSNPSSALAVWLWKIHSPFLNLFSNLKTEAIASV